ncbi:phage virion morphogenesis protein [Haemophilus influenzae]|uniref:Mu-like prophage FluMu G protein 1 n=1 Tax=Haemophilus influenzae (strain ATCC 51907 / DSM 11121 / KW20 / Rd) TaxID=71421 RepID=VPG1_HAEIN|nr:phage virion morphogenesis protein [Haemophilus influenzae]O05072.1 RecName: Full=Mu-like prophage FluMu G protein 1 [Haemophilus influenzae Rd KW20]AAC23153.1 G protein (muG-1) [Haemophilus influenzae Rd KW20]ARB89463.1 phage virion morphogenesis protein [Haemophilus influenzae]EEW76898.1 phage virion morphogenesis [Haemophilus influenzae RdAW]MCK9046596.1 phage virion morphogenesis protein [Haemophilus influenzae]
MHIEYKFDTSTIQQKFKKLAQVMDGRDITRKVAGVLRQEAEKFFDLEQAPTGEKWEDLDEDYKKYRYAAGHTGKILQIRGGRGLAGSLSLDYGDNYALIGAAEEYGGFHQLGTTFMPARPFLGLGKDGVSEIKAILNRELSELTQE